MFYKDIAAIYAKSRPAYPPELFELIVGNLAVAKPNLYVDLGCGTGELLFPLSKYFQLSVGVDPDQDMLAQALIKKNKFGYQNTQLVLSTAEDYLLNLDNNIRIDLVTCGRSFHWMNQLLVTEHVYKRLNEGGTFVTLGESSGGIWRRNSDWAKAVYAIMNHDFAYKATFVPARGHFVPLDVLKQNLNSQPFRQIKDYELEVSQQWTVDTILNLFYSGSGFLQWLGDEQDMFEQKVRKELTKINPLGVFQEIATFGVTICTK